MKVVPYIGTWIETKRMTIMGIQNKVVPYIGTWIETIFEYRHTIPLPSRTLYRYVD